MGSIDRFDLREQEQSRRAPGRIDLSHLSHEGHGRMKGTAKSWARLKSCLETLSESPLLFKHDPQDSTEEGLRTA
jgi:hypothetical protein